MSINLNINRYMANGAYNCSLISDMHIHFHVDSSRTDSEHNYKEENHSSTSNSSVNHSNNHFDSSSKASVCSSSELPAAPSCTGATDGSDVDSLPPYQAVYPVPPVPNNSPIAQLRRMVGCWDFYHGKP